MKRLEDLSAAELERRFPPRRPPPVPVPHATEPRAIVRPTEGVAEGGYRPVGRGSRPSRPPRKPSDARASAQPVPVLIGAHCGACGRQWAETSRSTACPFCGAER